MSTPHLRQLPILLMVAFGARLPFLLPGYGIDSDAWRVGVAAKVMHETGRFASSRVPGHPVQDLAAWALSGTGALGLNLVTAILSIAAVGLFYSVARRLRTPRPFLLSLGFAFMPVMFVHSVDAMDYVWALAFLLAAVELVLARRLALAGACLGIAVGCRLTSLALLVALVPLCESGRRVSDIAKIALVAILVGALCYMPVIATSGFGYLRFTPTPYPRPLYIAKALSIDMFGLVGCLGIGIALLAGRWRFYAPASWWHMRVASLAMLAVSLPVFLRLPDDSAYLLPVIPFVLWSLATLLSPRRVAILALALAASGFVFRLREDRLYVPAWHTGPTLKLGDRLALDLAGPIFVDHARRVAQDSYAHGLRSALPVGATLLSADWWPVLFVTGAGSEVVEYPTAAQLDTLRRKPLYYVPTAEHAILERTGLDVTRWGALPLSSQIK